MTSILKVDQIQTTAGAAPSAKDLGLNVTGNTLNHYYVTASTQTTLNSSAGNYFDIGLSKTLTPVSASSKFYIEYNVLFYVGLVTGGWLAAGGRILRDSTAIKTDSYSLGRGGYYVYSNSGTIVMFNTHDGFLDSPSTTSSITYKAQFGNYQSGYPMYANQGGQQGFLKITEIEG